MDSATTGVGLVLGRVLMPWCDQIKPNTLERYIEIGGFQGYRRLKNMSPLDVLAELRNSGLRDRGPTAEPVYLNWQQFLRRQDPGLLVVDATQYDDRSQSGSFLLTRNPFALVESLLIASVACQANKCVVLLPPALQDYEAILLNSFESVLATDLSQGQSLDLELLREARPSLFLHGPMVPFKESILMQKLETWYHLALVFSLGATRYKTMAPEGQTGTCLLTMGGPLRSPGLVEVPLGGNLGNILETLTGGLIPGFVPTAISLDNGFGGYLPFSAVQERLSPEEMSSVYVTPSPSCLLYTSDAADE